MEDINNALLHIKAKHNGEIPYQYGSKECAKLMDSYAKEYHKRQLKLLGIVNVVGRSEQLRAFSKWYEENYQFQISDRAIQEYERYGF